MYGLAALAFIVAAIIALLGVHGISVEVILGIMSIGGALLSLGLAGLWSTWPAMHFRRVPPAA